MGISDKFCQLGRLLEEWERQGATIRSTTVTDRRDLEGEGVRAEVTVALDLACEEGRAIRRFNPTVSSDGTVSVSVETSLDVESTGIPAEVEPVDSTVGPDGALLVTVATTVESTERSRPDEAEVEVEDRSSEHPSVAEHTSPDEHRNAAEHPSPDEHTIVGGPTSAAGTSAARDVPPFEDRALLAEVYETHDTFAEMADALEMDVTGETVRRYMIDHGIHQPNTYSSPKSDSADEEADASAESVVLSDGIGLPEGVTVEDVIETVNASNTIHEVKTDLGLERQEAHEMLKELNLIDLVLGRLSDDSRREITRDDVAERLREVSEQRHSGAAG